MVGVWLGSWSGIVNNHNIVVIVVVIVRLGWGCLSHDHGSLSDAAPPSKAPDPEAAPNDAADGTTDCGTGT